MLVFSVPDMDSLMENVSFLHTCLIRRGRFASASAEKSWGKFHAACMENIPKLLPMVISAEMHLSLHHPV